MKSVLKTAFIAGAFISSSLQVNAYETVRHGKVITSKPVWSVQTFTTPTTYNECVQASSLAGYGDSLLGDIIIGGLIGSVAGNVVSDTNGVGAFGTSVGALIAANRHSHKSPRYPCIRRSVHAEYKEKVISHYEVKVRLQDKLIIFDSDRSYKQNSLVKIRANSSYSLLY
jgi:hypothetical protein